GGYSPRPAISADGNVVAFESPLSSLVAGDTNNAADVFVVAGGVVTRVAGAGGVQLACAAQRPSPSATGRYVVSDSCATNAAAGTVTRASNTFNGGQPNGASLSAGISPNGRYVAYISFSSNIVGGASGTQVYRYDRDTSTTILISRASGGGAAGDGPASGKPS